MKTINKDFDCVQMKNDIQAKIYAETKDMSFEQYQLYLYNRLQNDQFWNKISMRKRTKEIIDAQAKE